MKLDRSLATIISSLIFTILLLGCVGDEGPPPTPANASDIVGDAVLGSPSAKVTMVEFSDYECPFCRSFDSDTFPGLIEKYISTGKVRFSVRQLPLPIHSNAHRAAEAAECAGTQGGYWLMHDKLFQNQDALSEENYKKWAGEIRISTSSFNQCMDSNAMAQKVDADVAFARSMNIRSVPIFYVGDKVFRGAGPLAEFEKVIDEELARQAT
jgi:protein-disulfide isomerase